MDSESKSPTVEKALADLSRRTLSKISGDMARLIYLASTRDYNTGKYHHDGLAAQFGAEMAGQALEMAHRQVFYRIAACPLEQIVQDVAAYIDSSKQGRDDVLRAWQKLEPYRVALPLNVNPAVAELFTSNVRLALAILQRRPALTSAS